MELLYEKQHEFEELKRTYISDLSGKFTLGYALQLGFNNMYLRLSNGERIEIGWLYREGKDLVYSGSCNNLQLMTLCTLDDIYDDADEYTCIVVKCYHKEDESRFISSTGELTI